jgi:hypothetical protein
MSCKYVDLRGEKVSVFGRTSSSWTVPQKQDAVALCAMIECLVLVMFRVYKR